MLRSGYFVQVSVTATEYITTLDRWFGWNCENTIHHHPMGGEEVPVVLVAVGAVLEGHDCTSLTPPIRLAAHKPSNFGTASQGLSSRIISRTFSGEGG